MFAAGAYPGGVGPGAASGAGATLNARVQVTGTGTTTVRAMVWTGAAEPTAWQMTRTDATAALQAAGGVGLAAHRPSTTTVVTDVRVTTFSARPVA